MKLWMLTALALMAFFGSVLPGRAEVGDLQIGTEERGFFALGVTLARGAFAYAALAKEASAIGKKRGTIDQVGQLARLDPAAGRGRAEARAEMGRAAGLLRQLHAPEPALAPILAAQARLSGPLPLTGDAKPLSYFNRAAARTVASLAEFETLSSLPDDPALRQWLGTPAAGRAASVWYAEGEIAGLSQIAAAHEMPELLPPTAQIATDLRGLRDWLAEHLPEMPSAEQAALKHDLNAFLEDAAVSAPPGVRPQKPLSLPQLRTLGSLCRRLQSQVLGETPAAQAHPNS